MDLRRAASVSRCTLTRMESYPQSIAGLDQSRKADASGMKIEGLVLGDLHAFICEESMKRLL